MEVMNPRSMKIVSERLIDDVQNTPPYRRFFKLWKDGILHFFPSRYEDELDPKTVTAASEAKTAFRKYLEYHGMKEVPKIVKNQRVDVKALLSSHDKSVNRDFLINRLGNKVPIDSLKGKHLLICCFFLPVFHKSAEAAACRAIIAFNSELPEKDRENFQIIIVPKLHHSLQTLEPFPTFLFDHFFSEFPDNFLAIPSSDYQSCDHVYDSVVLFKNLLNGALYIDPEEMALQTSGTMSSIQRNGAAAFPFTDSHLLDFLNQDLRLKLKFDTIYKEHSWNELGKKFDELQLRNNPVSLEELLECQSIYNMDNNKEVAVSYFEDKLVGLYIFCNGHFLFKLANIHEECIDEQKQFDIVLVCLDILDDSSSILELVKLNLESKGFDLSCWWTFPYNYKVSRKLWRMCDSDHCDKLIVRPSPPKFEGTNPSHEGQWSGDLQGKAVMCEFGGFSAYPFTRLAILEKKLSSLEKVTHQTMLDELKVTVWDEDDESLPKRTVPDFNGKQVLFCADYFELDFKSFSFFGFVRDWYPKIKAEHPNSEVVFVALQKPPSNRNGDPIFEMPFLVASSLPEQFKYGCYTFGENGRLLSREAALYLNKFSIDRLFQNHLREEIVRELFELQNDSL